MRRALLLLLLPLAACLGARDDAAPRWAHSAAQRHAQADALLERGERAAAERVLESILADAQREPVPAASQTARILVQDTCFRLSVIALEASRAPDALRFAEQGLALGDAQDLYAANLLVARAAASEALAQPQRALDDYASALQINEALLSEALERP